MSNIYIFKGMSRSRFEKKTFDKATVHNFLNYGYISSIVVVLSFNCNLNSASPNAIKCARSAKESMSKECEEPNQTGNMVLKMKRIA